MRYLWIVCLCLLCGCTPVNQIGQSDVSGDTLMIGILHHEENERTKQMEKGFIDYLTSRGFGQNKVVYISNDGLGKSEIDDLFIEQFVNEGVDLIYVIDEVALRSAVNYVKGSEVPVLCSGLNEVEASSYHLKNVKVLIEVEPLAQQFSTIRSMLPEASTIMVLNDSELSFDAIQVEGEQQGFTLIEYLPDVEQLEETIDAYFYIGDENAGSFYDLFKEENKPMFINDVDSVVLGFTAAIDFDDYAMGQLVGELAYEHMGEGVSLSELNNQPYLPTSITLNQKAMDNLGIIAPDFILKKAKIMV